MTLACDFRVGGSRTTLSFPEVGLGIIPGFGGTQRSRCSSTRRRGAISL